jgi:hypothetical protein
VGHHVHAYPVVGPASDVKARAAQPACGTTSRRLRPDRQRGKERRPGSIGARLGVMSARAYGTAWHNGRRALAWRWRGQVAPCVYRLPEPSAPRLRMRSAQNDAARDRQICVAGLGPAVSAWNRSHLRAWGVRSPPFWAQYRNVPPKV